jgi:hypothetical protein
MSMSTQAVLSKPNLDGRTFQQPLIALANTHALKVQREGPQILPKPAWVTTDIFVLLRLAMHTYDLFFFLNADERRKKDVDWRVAYSVASLPLIRCMIDCLYNVTVILQNPGVKGYQFRESGYKKTLEALDADERRYGGDPKWDAYIANQRGLVRSAMRNDGLVEIEVRQAKSWKTLSAYLQVKKNVSLTPHQEFLKKLTYGFWQEYSGMAHATFEGLLPTALFYTVNDMPHELRPNIEASIDVVIAIHIPRVAALLLCMLTEVQTYFHFDGARIGQRLHQIWNALLPAPEVKELYDLRYAKLMADKGITPEGVLPPRGA